MSETILEVGNMWNWWKMYRLRRVQLFILDRTIWRLVTLAPMDKQRNFMIQSCQLPFYLFALSLFEIKMKKFNYLYLSLEKANYSIFHKKNCWVKASLCIKNLLKTSTTRFNGKKKFAFAKWTMSMAFFIIGCISEF